MKIALVSALSGPEEIQGLNRRFIGGRPLFEISILHAVLAKCFDKIVIMSDDLDIINYTRKKWSQVDVIPIPKEFKKDQDYQKTAIFHALVSIECLSSDWVMLLPVTSPLRKLKDIRLMANEKNRPGIGTTNSIINNAMYWSNVGDIYQFGNFAHYYFWEVQNPFCLSITTEYQFNLVKDIVENILEIWKKT